VAAHTQGWPVDRAGQGAREAAAAESKARAMALGAKS
jgi:hypothetical protein